jgi:hypothetical protein
MAYGQGDPQQDDIEITRRVIAEAIAEINWWSFCAGYHKEANELIVKLDGFSKSLKIPVC